MAAFPREMSRNRRAGEAVAITAGRALSGRFTSDSVSQARIDRPVDKRRASHPLPLPRLHTKGCEQGALFMPEGVRSRSAIKVIAACVLGFAAVWSVTDAKVEDVQKLDTLCKEEGARLTRVYPDWKKEGVWTDPSVRYNYWLSTGAKLQFGFSTNINECVALAIGYPRNEWRIYDVAPQAFIDYDVLFSCGSDGVFNVLFDVVRRLNRAVYHEAYPTFADNGEGGFPMTNPTPSAPYTRDKCEQLFKNKIAELGLVHEPKW
jgi:hypothetical protein